MRRSTMVLLEHVENCMISLVISAQVLNISSKNLEKETEKWMKNISNLE